MRNHKPKKISNTKITDAQLFTSINSMNHVWLNIKYNILLTGKHTLSTPNLKMDAYYYETKTPNLLLLDQNDVNIVYIGEL